MRALAAWDCGAARRGLAVLLLAGAPALGGQRAAELPLLPSPDGSLLAVVSERGLTLLDPEGRELARLELGGRASELAFSPDGRRLAVALEEGGLALYETAAPFRRAAADDQPCSGLAWSPDGSALYFAVRRTSASGGSAVQSVQVKRYDLAAGAVRSLHERETPLAAGPGLPVHPPGEDGTGSPAAAGRPGSGPPRPPAALRSREEPTVPTPQASQAPDPKRSRGNPKPADKGKGAP